MFVLRTETEAVQLKKGRLSQDVPTAHRAANHWTAPPRPWRGTSAMLEGRLAQVYPA